MHLRTFLSLFENEREINKQGFLKDPKKFLEIHPINAFNIFPVNIKKSDLEKKSHIYPFILTNKRAVNDEIFLELDLKANQDEKINALSWPS